MKHTPLPWKVQQNPPTDGSSVEIMRDNLSIARAWDWPNAADNAAYIVTACNSFPDLVEALKDMVDTFSGYQGMQLTRAQEALKKAGVS